MNSESGLCWCASEIKCPHGISAKIPLHWDVLEKVFIFRYAKNDGFLKISFDADY